MAPSSTPQVVGLIDRYKAAHPEVSDAAIARRVGVSPANLSQWRSKGVRGLLARSTLDALAATLGCPYREVLDAALADAGYTPPPASSTSRTYREVLADAIAVLTEATRLHDYASRQNASGGWEPDLERPVPIDWAEFVCAAMAGAAANAGGIATVLAGRPGSWEAAVIRDALVATVGDDEHDLWRHRTEPLHVVIRPEDIVDDLDSEWLRDEDLDDADLDRRENAISPSRVYSYPGHELDDRMRAHYADRGVIVIDGTPPPLPPLPSAEEWEAALAAAHENELTPEEQAVDEIARLREQLAEHRRTELRDYGEQIASAVGDRLERLPGLTVPITVTVEVGPNPYGNPTAGLASHPAPVVVDPRWATNPIDIAIAEAIQTTPDPGTWPGTPLSRFESGHTPAP
ncbi:XRE family transcriptional regulator [Gordonia sp. N1V]|uniref:helix-turn-helix domain-containing protein n=1 Tax=Gordonia sp. N1V TaxID=3034163 RepID=UPI0023E19CCB|nr:XRE family transcriptional regulator [Gordonia sp. N1V]MDF3285053.1 XRE family transcriptional regulator [Gordonia sp. N1V]